eukprot:COSAG02_NODE_57549_length_280_cov_0.679558_1_plen_48_part_10
MQCSDAVIAPRRPSVPPSQAACSVPAYAARLCPSTSRYKTYPLCVPAV